MSILSRGEYVSLLVSVFSVTRGDLDMGLFLSGVLSLLWYLGDFGALASVLGDLWGALFSGEDSLLLYLLGLSLSLFW